MEPWVDYVSQDAQRSAQGMLGNVVVARKLPPRPRLSFPPPIPVLSLDFPPLLSLTVSCGPKTFFPNSNSLPGPQF